MSILAAISFDPTIRGLLVVATGVVVLIGSIYLIVATNVGIRNGLLIVLTCLFGWCFTMGSIWWVYGIGLRGRDPSWSAKEVNFSRDTATITDVGNKLPRTESLPDPVQLFDDWMDSHPGLREKIEASEGQGYEPETLTKVVTLIPELKGELDAKLGGWRILPESDARRGDAVAASDAALAATSAFGQNTSTSAYTIKDVFFYGGKGAAEPETIQGERSNIARIWRRVVQVFEPKNPPLYAAVTVQKNVEQVVAPGEAPPPAQIDDNAQTVTVIMERDLGNRRLWPALFALGSGILFAVCAWMLHTRDKRAMKMREDWKPDLPVKVG